MGETAVKPKTPPLARRGRAIGDNGSTKGASDASVLGSVDRLSPIDRKLEGTVTGGRNSRRTEDAAAGASRQSHWGQWLYHGSPLPLARWAV